MALLAAACAAPVADGSRRPALTAGEARAAAWLEAHRSRPPMLRAFLQRMPKGGDIHTHLTGAVYAESFIAWGAESGMCLDTAAGAITAPPCDAQRGRLPLAEAVRDAARYGALVDALSTRNLAKGESGHQRFFNAFSRFSAVTATRGADMVAELAAGAAAQHVGYLEMMLTIRGQDVRALAAGISYDGDPDGARRRLLDAGLPRLVQQGVADLAAIERGVDRRLGCGTAGAAPPACRVVRRYLQQSSRTGEPGVVFAQLLYAFELARADRRVVGINLVAPEDDPVSLRDYSLHMRMVGWLVAAYPGVNVALHAGELTMGLVPPGHLAFHIREAVEVAGARRIGHGVSVGYERDAVGLMQMLRARDVLVEICLTSNDVILGVAGAAHPFADYWRLGVPVALATDDQGVSRIDLTSEFLRAALAYGLGYADLKRLARNSVSHAFLAGPGLWRDRAALAPAEPCAGARPGEEPAPACRRFLDGSDKAAAQWALEAEFAEFEALPMFR